MVVIHDNDGATFALDDDDFAAEEGCSPALLGGYTVPTEISEGKMPEPCSIISQQIPRNEHESEGDDS